MSRNPSNRLQTLLSVIRRRSGRQALKRAYHRTYLHPSLEQLEPRQLLAIDLPAEILVGRTLSAYSSNDVQNSQLKLTYSVYNQREVPIDDVRLTDTLKPGVTFVEGSQPPDQNGQDFAWSLGSIPAYGRASVEITVSLAANILQLDEGAQVFATVDAGVATDDAPAAILRSSPITAAELASTIDANTTDPVIQEKAAELDYDPASIFAYLRDEVGYESYVGSLRGARGTIWSEAGNSLDETSLGVALFRASGIPARYAHGTLSDADTQALILSMFSEPTQIVGYLAPGTEVADPANDPTLLAETRDHYWLQIDVGAGFLDADTSGLPGSGIGTSFTTTNDTFNEVADALRHKVRVSLEAETYSQAQGAFNGGNAITISRVLDRTWNAVDLVGKPLSVSQFVTDDPQGGLVFVSRSLTYTPYFLLGDTTDPNGLGDEIFTGTPFQEQLTNFPLGSQILTGLKLSMDLAQPGGQTEHHERMLVDRIGYANRQSGTSANLAVDSNGNAALNVADVFTLNVLPGRTDPNDPVQLFNRVMSAQDQLNSLLETQPPGFVDQLRSLMIDATRLLSLRNNQASDVMTVALAKQFRLRAYEDQPRLVIATGRVYPGSPTVPGRLAFSLDLRRDVTRAVVAPGQPIYMEPSYQILGGQVITLIEREVIASTVAPEDASTIINTWTVFENAVAQHVPIVMFLPNDAPLIPSRMVASPEALARITVSLQSGNAVLVPARPVQVGATETTAWFETNVATGQTIGVTEDGGHNAAPEYVWLLAKLTAFTFGFAAGFGFGLRLLAIKFPDLKPAIANYVNTVGNAAWGGTVAGGVGALGNPIAGGSLAALSGAYASGLGFGWSVAGLGANLFGSKDPPAEDAVWELLGDLNPPNRDTATRTIPTASGLSLRLQTSTPNVSTDQNTPVMVSFTLESELAGDYELTATGPENWLVRFDGDSVEITPAPGTQSGTGAVRLVARSKSNPALVSRIEIAVNVTPTQPGVTLAVEADPLLTVSYLGAELPTAYTASFRNLGADADQYSLSVSNVTHGWEVLFTDNELTLPGGVTGLLGVYLRPTGASIPLPGTSITFSLTVTSQTDQARTQVQTMSLVMPEVRTTRFSNSVSLAGALPGTTYDGTIQVRNSGNVQETVTLSVESFVDGVSVAGFPQQLTLAPNESIDVSYSLAIANTIPLNTTGIVQFRITSSTVGVPPSSAFNLTLRMVVPGAEAILIATNTAVQLGKIELSDRLDTLALSLTNLVGNPTDVLANSQAVAALDAVIRIIDADPILGSFYTSGLGFARDQIASATTITEVQDALDFLASHLTSMSQTLTELVEHNFTFGLATNVVTALPGVPARFPILLENNGTQATTFDLSVGGFLPFDTTATFSQSTVTLQPGERLDGGPSGVTLELSFTESLIFPTGFTVIATPQEAPSLTQQVSASVAVRAEFIQVATVTPSPAFTEPGGSVAISARILNVVNREQVVLVSYRVTDSNGSTVFTSASQAVTLNVRSSLTDVALPAFDTTSLAREDYTVTVSVTDASGASLPGGSGQATLLIGTPVSATLTVSPDSLLSLDSFVTNTLRLDAQTVMPNPLTLLGQVQTLPTATTILVNGNIAYVAGTNGIDIVNVANPSAPQVVGTFGQGQIVQGGFTVVRAFSGDRIIVATRGTLNAATFTLLTYSIANPTAP
ncbi:MAG: transglutaminase domain-containing protein, partial [Pirellula sp.]